MDAKQIEVFVHSAGAKPKVVEALADEILRDVLAREGFAAAEGAGILVFVGECDEALGESEDVEDGADEHASVDPAKTLHELDLARHRHVHVHRCRRIAIEVNFLNKTKRHHFSPAATIAVVTAWARKKFEKHGLDPSLAHQYVLQLCKTTKRPRADEHLGELVTAADCSLCFDLVKEITPQG